MKTKKKADLTNQERLELLDCPYLRINQIKKLLNISYPTIKKILASVNYYPMGYLTDDVIETFRLNGAITRWKEGLE